MKKILICILLSASTLLAADIPYLTGRVTDLAEIISPDTLRSLNEMLKKHEFRTTNQIAVLTIRALNGESIEDYAVRVFNEWKLGQEDQNNGVLILVVPDDRQMRIEVGYGLEPTLTDLTAGRIIRNVMTPKFREGDYNAGISAGVRSVMAILEGVDEQDIADLADVPDNSEKSEFFFSGDTGLTITERILIGAFVFGIIGIFTLLGILTPGFGWFLYFFLIPFWAMFPIVVFGTKGAFICLLVYLVGFPAAKLMIKDAPWYKKAKIDLRTKGQASIGGFTFSSGSSGSSWSSGSSSFSSGGGFSGGGGSSGGGGASGRW